MKTSNIGNITVSIPNTKQEKFNLSHDNNTTYDWGSIQPTLCKMMLPDSSINVEDEQLIRMAPMVVPTFGRIKIKNIAHFIPMEEIFPNWDAMMSQTKVTRTAISNGQPSTSTYVPKQVPSITNNILVAWCLAGCKANLYFSGTLGTIEENTWYCARNTGTWDTPAGWPTATTATREYGEKILGITNTNSPTTSAITNLKYTGYKILLNRIITKQDGTRVLTGTNSYDVVTLPTITTMTNTPLANANGQGYTHSFSNEQNAWDSTQGDEHITFDGADMIWEYAGSDGTGIKTSDRTANNTPVAGITSSKFDGCKIRIVFKLSSFGKRLRKTLIGLGYDVNLANDDNVSILPLIAYYKAWWDSYAPEREKNFYETNAWKLIQASMAGASGADLTTTINNANAGDLRNYFIGFMGDIGTCFATEKIDAVSAATDNYYAGSNTTQNAAGSTDIQNTIMATIREVLNEPRTGGALGTSINADGSSNVEYTTTYNGSYTSLENGISMMLNVGNITANGSPHITQPQIDAIKKSYIMMNKTSVAGMAVEEILRALGQGDFVEECKGKFINDHDEAIKISDVIATAATDKASLGQYGGRGLGLTNLKFSYKTNRYGYIIILSCIIPESGYINAPAHENEAINFQKMFNPEFDGIAYEAIQKKCLGGSPLINDKSYRNTFGYLPTYTQWKFMSNKANGDFSLNSRKSYMTPYTLDKYIPIGDANVYKVEEANGHAGSTAELCSPTFTYNDLANAGEDYRYINKFPWNGSYNRIFEAQDDGLEWSVFSPNNNAFLFNAFEYDNFMVHNVFAITYWAHMKSIEKSYGTYDEEHGAPESTIKRS